MPTDLPSHWLLDRFGHETLQNFELLLNSQDQNKKTKTYSESCFYLGQSISTTLGQISSGGSVSLITVLYVLLITNFLIAIYVMIGLYLNLLLQQKKVTGSGFAVIQI